MKSFFSKNKKKIIAISSIFLFASLFFLYPDVALAEDGKNVARVLGWIIWPFIFIMGQLATLLLGVLIKIAQYNDFINSSAVSYGWVVVRDLCNMFFVLILLIIAFASILRVDSYNLKTWLPKLVIMAVLINFSKLICGIFIDFAQVVMLTFVNAFKDIAGANLTDMLGISKILSFNEGSTSEVTAWTIIGSMVLALIFSVIAVVVIVAMLAMLAMRIVLIWIYVVLSPIAYLMAAFPQGQSNSQRWWSDFSKNVIVGPILAFFIWLAFASLGGVEGEAEIEKIRLGEAREKSGLGDENSTKASDQLLTEAGSEGNLIKMIISIGMLLGGLMLAQEMGDRSGKIAGKGLTKLQTMGAGSLKLGKRAVGIERAQNAVKAYQQRKESTRSDLATRDAGSLLKAEEKTKKTLAYIPNQAAKGTSNLIKRPFGLNDKKLEERSKEIEDKENKLGDYKKKAESFDLTGDIDSVKSLENSRQERLGENNQLINQANDLENSQNRYKTLEQDLYFMPQNDPNRASKQKEFDEEAKKLEGLKQEAGLSKNASEADVNNKVADLRNEHSSNEQDINNQFNQSVSDKKAEIETKYNDLTGENRDFAYLESNVDSSNGVISNRISTEEKELKNKRQELDESRKKAENIDKGVGAVAGGIAGAVIGSAFGAPLPFIGLKIAGIGLAGGALGARSGWKAKGKLAHAGEDAMNLASNYNNGEIDKAKEGMKDKSPDELRAIAKDYSRTSPERAAASLINIERGELKNSEAEVAVANIRESFKGDSKVENRVDAAVMAHYPSLNTDVQEMKETLVPVAGETAAEKDERERRHESKKEKIIKGIVSGTIKLENIDDQETLDMIIPKLANTISASNLAAMHKNQTSKKQGMIEKSLRGAPASDSKSGKALVNITNSLGDLGSDSQKTKYMEGANEAQLGDLFQSTKGINSVVDWLEKAGGPGGDPAMITVLNEIKRSGGDVRKIMNALNKVTKKGQMSMDSSKNKASIGKLARTLLARGIV